MKARKKFYYFALHPVHYHIGVYRELAKLDDIEFKVIYEDDIGIRPTFDSEFNTELKWDIDLVGGYSHKFLKNFSRNPHGGFFSRINPSIVKTFIVDNPSVIMLKGYVNFSDWLVMLMAKVTRTKVIFRGEATLDTRTGSTNFKQKIKYYFLKYWLKKCDAVMYTCSGNKHYWEHYGVNQEKLYFLPCAVDNEFFESEYNRLIDNRLGIRESLGISLDDFVVISVSRINENKNLQSLVESISNIEHRNIHLLFVGDGPDREYIEGKCRSLGIKSTFVGFKNITEVSKYYAIADVFVLLSKYYEYSPKSLNEAMNFGLPVIVTSLAGTAIDLVKDNGYIVEPTSIERISNAIDWLNKNRCEAKVMGRKSSILVDSWNFSSGAKSINQAIDDVLSS